MKIQMKDVGKWFLCWILFLVIVFLFLSGVETGTEQGLLLEDSNKSAVDILINNSKNFLAYFLLFPLSPLLLLYELLLMGVSLYMGYQVYGLSEFLFLLLPHGLLEFPNILFYSFLAFHLFRCFIKRPSFQTIWQTVWANRQFYVGSYLAVVVAALLEVI